VEEAAAMRGAVSAATGRCYPLTMICAVFRVARSTVYRTMAPAVSVLPIAAKRGPKTRWSDDEVVAAIRLVLAATPFHGEGYRKIRARLAHRGLAIGGKRVLRLMRVHHLLAPRRLGPPNGDPAQTPRCTLRSNASLAARCSAGRRSIRTDALRTPGLFGEPWKATSFGSTHGS